MYTNVYIIMLRFAKLFKKNPVQIQMFTLYDKLEVATVIHEYSD